MVGTLPSAFPDLIQLQLSVDRVRVFQIHFFFFFWIADSGTSHNLRDWDSGGGASTSLLLSAPDCVLPPSHSFSPHTYLPKASRWGSLGLPGRAGASQPAPAWCSRGEPSLGERGQGEVRCSCPRDWSGRWARLGAQRGRGRPRGRAGRQDPESSAARGVWGSDLDCGCAEVEWRFWLLPPSIPRVPSVRAARRGDDVAPCPRGRAVQEAAPGGATEGPWGALWVSQIPSPAPTTKLASEGGGRADGGHSEFPATFPGCGKLLCRARTEGRSD